MWRAYSSLVGIPSRAASECVVVIDATRIREKGYRPLSRDDGADLYKVEYSTSLYLLGFFFRSD